MQKKIDKAMDLFSDMNDKKRSPLVHIYTSLQSLQNGQGDASFSVN